MKKQICICLAIILVTSLNTAFAARSSSREAAVPLPSTEAAAKNTSSTAFVCTAHSWGQWVEIVPASCVGGVKQRTCRVCGATESYVTPAVNGHQWGEWTVIRQPTADSQGIRESFCLVCGLRKEESYSISQGDDEPGTVIPGAAKLILPAALKLIDDAAFYGDSSLDQVILPDGITTIGSNAFSNSTLSFIRLPDSLTYISNDAFDAPGKVTVEANPGTYAYEWAVENGYIQPVPSEPVAGTWGTCQWELSKDNALTIHAGQGADTNGVSPWFTVRTRVKSITADGTVVLPADSSSLFDGFVNCTQIQVYSFDTSHVTNMHALFRGCACEHWSMSGFNTATVTDMGSMFENCKNLSYQAFYNFDTSNVQDMSRMFACCEKMTYIGNPENITTSSAVNLSGMFYNCKGLQKLDLNHFDTSKVKNFSEMFFGCSSLTILDIGKFQTQNATDLHGMFAGCGRLLGLDLSGFNTLKAQSMSDMFLQCNALNSIKLGGKFSFKGKGGSIMTALPEHSWHSLAANRSFTEREIAENRNCIADTYNMFGVDDGFYYQIDDETHCTVMGYHGSSPDVIIPERSPGGHIVHQIGASAFNSRTDLTGILSIPATVTAIGEYAFYQCTGLTGDLVIPASVEKIGNAAFCNCGIKGTLTLQPGVKTIEREAFSCASFTGGLVIPASVRTIGDYAFSGCSGLNGALTIESGVETIGDGAFNNCSSLTGELILPDSIVSLGKSAFKAVGCNGRLTLPAKLTRIPENCFYEAKLTGSLSLPEGLLSIENGAFFKCSFTGSLVLPRSLQNVSGFKYCRFTGPLKLPDHLVSIGAEAFACCDGFSGDLVIPDSVTSIGSWAFCDCRGLNGELVLSRNVSMIPGCCFYRCWGLRGNIIIPEGVTEISNYAFSDCWGFDGRLQLPSTLKAIGERAFQLCSGINGDLIIPQGVCTMKSGAFTGCKSLNGTVYLPETLTQVSGKPFSEGKYQRILSLTGSLSYTYPASMISASALSSKVSKFLFKENSYAHLNADAHGFTPYEFITELKATVILSDDGDSEPDSPLHAYCGVTGGIKPYQFQYRLMIDGRQVSKSDWSGHNSFQVLPLIDGSYSVSVTVRDSLGSQITAVSKAIFRHILTDTESAARKERIFSAFAVDDFFDRISSPQSIEGYLYYQSYPDEFPWIMQWIKYLADFDPLNPAYWMETYDDIANQSQQKEFLLNKALVMCSTGEPFEMYHVGSLPSEIKGLRSFAKLQLEEAKDGLIGILEKLTGTSNAKINEIFKQYCDGKITSDLLEIRLNGIGMADAAQRRYAVSSMRILRDFHEIYTVSKMFGIVKTVYDDMVVDTINTVALLDTVDMNQLNALAQTWIGTGTAAQQEVGKQLRRLASVTRQERIEILLCQNSFQTIVKLWGNLANTEIGGWLNSAGSAKIGSMEIGFSGAEGALVVYSIANSALELLAGTKSFPDKMLELQAATEIVDTAWMNFTAAKASYKANPSKDHFTRTYYALINYLKSAEVAETAFVDLVNASQQKFVLLFVGFGEPMTTAKNRSQANADALHEFVENLNKAYRVWEKVENHNYTSVRNMMTNALNRYKHYGIE